MRHRNDLLYSTFLSLLKTSSFLFLSRSDEETQSMLSSVVASRSVSSDKANLFFAAERPDTWSGRGFMPFLLCALWFTTLLEAVTAAAEGGKELAEAHTSKVFDQWLAGHTKPNLQLQHGKLLRKLSAVDNDILSQRGVLCQCFFVQALWVFCLCERESKRERGRAVLDSLYVAV